MKISLSARVNESQLRSTRSLHLLHLPITTAVDPNKQWLLDFRYVW